VSHLSRTQYANQEGEPIGTVETSYGVSQVGTMFPGSQKRNETTRLDKTSLQRLYLQLNSVFSKAGTLRRQPTSPLLRSLEYHHSIRKTGT